MPEHRKIVLIIQGRARYVLTLYEEVRTRHGHVERRAVEFCLGSTGNERTDVDGLGTDCPGSYWKFKGGLGPLPLAVNLKTRNGTLKRYVTYR